MEQEFASFCRLDVGKSEHHATPLNAAGERVFDKPLPHDEGRRRTLFTALHEHGQVLVVVDQPNMIGALPSLSPGTAAAKSHTCRDWRCAKRLPGNASLSNLLLRCCGVLLASVDALPVRRRSRRLAGSA
ncbi:MAG: family transposase [Bryobacterales bacterium]|nr:family transposase [Bryobacterales bacterium]